MVFLWNGRPKASLCEGGGAKRRRDCSWRFLMLSFRASDRCHWRGNPYPAPADAKLQSLPCAKGGVMAEGHDGGIVCIGFLPRHSEPVTDVTGVGIRSPFLCLRRPLFFQQRKKRGKETPPKTTFLDFLTRLRPQLISLVLPRERCAVEISPKCCIVSASLFAAAFALKCRAVQAWQEHFLNSGLWPPPTFAALRQRRDLIIAQTPGVRFPKGRGRDPSLLVVSRGKDL